ncbi:hypothetical protein [Clostridium acetireducens]|uniref:hypothetical protein n=1 Tax=Clostridium acetireducens TaxID=76489 RepID=UPI0011131BA7|nr:hypothetical protein [Clostridium acetireducens]
MFCNPCSLILLLLILQNCGCQSSCKCVVNTRRPSCHHKHHCHSRDRGGCGSVTIHPKKTNVFIQCPK